MEFILKVNVCTLPDADDPDYDTILRECIADAVEGGDFEIMDE